MTVSSSGCCPPSAAVISPATRRTACPTSSGASNRSARASSACASAPDDFKRFSSVDSIGKSDDVVIHRLLDDIGAADGFTDFGDQVVAPQIQRRGAYLELDAGFVRILD